jgi:putative Holliday junction resolvase
MGLAVGNDRTGTASPFEVVPYEGVPAAARRIAETAERLGAGRIVLGLPTLADGSVGPAARRSEQLAEELARLGLDVVLQGEFLTTDEARRRARAAGRAPRQAVDDLAAQVILEEYLSGLDGPTRETGP